MFLCYFTVSIICANSLLPILYEQISVLIFGYRASYAVLCVFLGYNILTRVTQARIITNYKIDLDSWEGYNILLCLIGGRSMLFTHLDRWDGYSIRFAMVFSVQMCKHI